MIDEILAIVELINSSSTNFIRLGRFLPILHGLTGFVRENFLSQKQ